MSTREHCENISPDTGSHNMSTDTTHESAAADTENLNIAFDKLTMTCVDSTCDALTLASVDNTSDTLTLASVDNTSDTLTLASVDNTSDTLTLFSVDSTSDTLTLVSVDSTSDTLTLVSVDSTSDTLTLASVDSTSDTLTLASVDNTSDTLTLFSVDSTSDTLTLVSVDSTSDTLTLASVDNTSDTLTLASVDNTSDTLTLASVDNTSDTLTLASVDNTSDTLTLASVDNTSDTLTLASVDNTSDTLTLVSVDSTSDTLTLVSVDSTCDALTLAGVDSTSDTLTLVSVDSTSDTLTLVSVDSTYDALTLAKLDRENQGPWEFEYSYEGEGNLHEHYNNCTKNPGHKKFIPIDKFSIADLPEDYRDNDIVDYIRAVAELTVCVTVKKVSDIKAATFPGIRKLDSGESVRALRRMTVGTGSVAGVCMVIGAVNGAENGPCQCNECRNLSTPVMDYATILIETAAHVAFEDHEREHTTTHLFFDRGNTPAKCSDVVTLTGTSPWDRSDLRDVCYMQHYTHDLDLARRLDQTVERMRKLKVDFYTKLPQFSKFRQRRDDLDRQPLLFIVSHPHGCSKQVSLGRWTSVDMFNNVIASFLYNTATCPGSSGASVCALPAFTNPYFDGRSDGTVSLLDGVHCGVSDVQRDLNFCGADRDDPAPTLISLEMLQLDKGPWEDHFCCLTGDDETDKHYAACKKNPGHRNFFPLETFNMDNLLPLYRRDDIMKCLQLVAGLTVRVTVNYVSEERPETVPGTDIPYPWFRNRGSNLMRAGSGWVDIAVTRNDEDCPCKECQNSLKPRRQFACIKIKTVTHLVYDQLEAERTTCDLFFDSGETPDVCKDIVTLTEMYTFDKSIELDACTIEYCTHNMDLVSRLDNMTDSSMKNLRSLNRYSYNKSTKSVKQNGGGNTKLETPLSIVVSHPHGCAKQVSIGYCDIRGNDDTEDSRCSTGGITCPGSSGAPMFVLSQRLMYPYV